MRAVIRPSLRVIPRVHRAMSSHQQSGSAPAKPRLSASLICIGPSAEPSSSGCDYRILLLQRKATGSFKSAYVFPGGVLEESDESSAWDPIHPASSEAERKLRALRICAMRETFEECGMLLEAGPVRDLRDRRAWRDKVHVNGEAFIELVKSRHSKLLLDDCVPFSHWITPRFMPRRWSTHFFVVVVSPEFARAAIRASADGAETVAAQWLEPNEAIRRSLLATSDPDAIELHPPQYFQLADLALCRSWRDLSKLGGPLFERRVVPVEPSLNIDEDGNGAMTYPGDAAYALPLPEMDGVDWANVKPHYRHRTNITLPVKTMRVTGAERKGVNELFGVAHADFDTRRQAKL